MFIYSPVKTDVLLGAMHREYMIKKYLFRTRQISTSLVQHPIEDHDLKDFHGHLLEPGHHPLDIK